MSTFGQVVAHLNRKDNIVEPHLAPAETSDVLLLYVPSNVDVADQERAIHGILNANIGEERDLCEVRTLAGTRVVRARWIRVSRKGLRRPLIGDDNATYD